MAKKKSKQVLRPWCWYCEREFEDEKVLMQHQKAKHFKCGMCPRRLNTAGGLAVHIQQVHKLEPENLPRIENALPGRDGYEVEIFGMEGIPAPDVADYKRRKEIELGLAAGSISQPQPKRPKIENRLLSEDELRAQLEAHKALMGASSDAPAATAAPEATAAVYNAPPYSICHTTCSYSWYPPSRSFATPRSSRHVSTTVHARFSPSWTFPRCSSNGSSIPRHAWFPSWSPTSWLSYATPWPGATRHATPGCPAIPSWCFSSASSTADICACGLILTRPTFYERGTYSAYRVRDSCSCSTAITDVICPHHHLYFLIPPSNKSMDLSRRKLISNMQTPNFSPEEKRAHTAKYYFASDATNTTASQVQSASGTEEVRGRKRARAEDFL
ncbi:hypothetical protein BKA83DRAFT_4156579 [Pisolithus microcarpus]|nr:hypothetical protein BKA83DRAFT_4156579 [Pisolithus microcarpus]